MNFVLLYCFFLLCHLCYLISAYPRPISREDAHRMYPRYPRVFSLCYNILPTPPPNLCERGLGVSLSCTCVAFIPFAKSNRFFPINNSDLLWYYPWWVHQSATHYTSMIITSWNQQSVNHYTFTISASYFEYSLMNLAIRHSYSNNLSRSFSHEISHRSLIIPLIYQ